MIRKRLRTRRDLHLERMFETRTEAWERVGLAVTVTQRAARRARREAAILIPILIGILVAYSLRKQLFGARYDTPVRIGTVIGLMILGWTLARDVGRAAAPTFFRRMDPSTAGTVGFLMRLATIVITLLVALRIAGLPPTTLVAGSAFTAVVLGLAAQQTLGNLFAGLVLLSARPFRVGERVRLQAGAVGGSVEGIVSSLGLLYTELARGEDRVLIPNNVVLAAAVVPLREPDSVDVRVRLGAGIPLTHVQAILDDHISTPTRSSATVLLQEVDGEDVVVRVQATPERSADGARLADEIIAALSTVTGQHAVARE
jgi:small conductance mechanosensitive channel